MGNFGRLDREARVYSRRPRYGQRRLRRACPIYAREHEQPVHRRYRAHRSELWARWHPDGREVLTDFTIWARWVQAPVGTANLEHSRRGIKLVLNGKNCPTRGLSN